MLYAILAGTRQVKSIHMQKYNIVTLLYLVKMGTPQSEILATLSKELWKYLLTKRVIIIAEYCQRALNKEIDFQRRVLKDTSECKLKT